MAVACGLRWCVCMCVCVCVCVCARVRGGRCDVCVNVVRRQVRVGVRGTIFISGCQEGDTLMNGAE